MLKLKSLTGLILAGALACAGMAAEKDAALPTGTYSARIKALACAGCAPLIEKSMRNLKEVGPVHVDTKSARLHFAVKEGASLKMSDLNAALKKSAGEMGMGADFTLSDLKKAETAKAGEPAKDQALDPGYYSARLGAVVCGGCKGLIEKTMLGVDGVGAAQVDEKKGTVLFTVMKGKKLQVARLQDALKLAADKMGMGADFFLSELKPYKKA